jgi:hypothetical protein
MARRCIRKGAAGADTAPLPTPRRTATVDRSAAATPTRDARTLRATAEAMLTELREEKPRFVRNARGDVRERLKVTENDCRESGALGQTRAEFSLAELLVFCGRNGASRRLELKFMHPALSQWARAAPLSSRSAVLLSRARPPRSSSATHSMLPRANAHAHRTRLPAPNCPLLICQADEVVDQKERIEKDCHKPCTKQWGE